MHAVDAAGIEKSFGHVAILRSCDLIARRGEVLTIFGPNGSGKTTLLRVLATLTRPDAGSVRVNGFDTATQGELARGSTGVVTHSPMLYGDLTARENLRFFARMFRLRRPDERIAVAAERMQITRRLDQRVGSLSHGFQKRVAISRALLHEPGLLLMDEPESGLDPSALELLDQVVADYRSTGRAVVMTTHAVERGLGLGDRLGVMSGGRVVLLDDRSRMDADAIRRAYSRAAAGT